MSRVLILTTVALFTFTLPGEAIAITAKLRPTTYLYPLYYIYYYPVLIILATFLVSGYVYAYYHGLDEEPTDYSASKLAFGKGGLTFFGLCVTWVTTHSYFFHGQDNLLLILYFISGIPAIFIYLFLWIAFHTILPLAVILTFPTFIHGLHFISSPQGARARRLEERQHNVATLRKKAERFRTKARDATDFIHHEVRAMQNGEDKEAQPHQSVIEGETTIPQSTSQAEAPTIYIQGVHRRFREALELRGETRLWELRHRFAETAASAMEQQANYETANHNYRYERMRNQQTTDDMLREKIAYEQNIERMKREEDAAVTARSIRDAESDIRATRAEEAKVSTRINREEYMKLLYELEEWRSKEHRNLDTMLEELIANGHTKGDRKDAKKRIAMMREELEECVGMERSKLIEKMVGE